MHRDRKKNGDCQELAEQKDGELLFNGHRVSVCKIKGALATGLQ